MVRRKKGSAPKRLLLTDVVERYLLDVDVRCEPSTLVSYRRRLGAFVQLISELCNVRYLDEVEVDHLRRCTQHLLNQEFSPSTTHYRIPENGSTLAVSTVRGYIRIWKAFFSWCLTEGLIDVNPADSRFRAPRPVKKIKATFTEETIKKMLAAFDTSDQLGFRNYVIVVLLLDTGIRLAEVAGLHVQDVNETYIKVFGKGRKEREVGIYPETRKLLWKYINRYRVPADENVTALFLTHSGTPLGVGGIKRILYCLKKDLAIENVKLSAHVFRHTFAKMYLESGGDVFKLSREMGHSDVQITKIYLEDFGSTEARKDHVSYSPLARFNLKKQLNKRKKDV